MGNPLQQLETAAKTSIQKTVDWAFGGRVWQDSNQKGKTDKTFQTRPMDTLRRAAFNNVFDTLFSDGVDRFPYVTPDKTLKKVIGKLSNNMFPRGTTITVADKGINETLQKMMKDIKWNLRTELNVQESALMGYSGIRSVWESALNRWLYEIKPKEYLVIESFPGVPEEIVAIGMEWPIERKERGKVRRYWKKERWTIEEYQVWPEKPETATGKPEFKPEEATTETNVYGEIPYTIVPHIYDPNCHGQAVVNEEEILNVKSLIRLRHKRHFGHLKFMDPNPVRKNHASPGEPLNLDIGSTIDLQQADEHMPTDLTLLEFAGMPESVKEEFYDTVKALYEAAGLKSPPPEDVFKAGVEHSGVALRIIDKDDADTIETLRDNGYSQILRHFEKMLRMGARLNLPEYQGINPEDEETWMVTAKFPSFFAPTDEEITQKILNYKMGCVPPKLRGPRVAALLGFEDEEEIKLITQHMEEKEELEEPGKYEDRNSGS